ncbi:Lipopolysaccharide biosynthesis protein [Janibacter sp. HTCC2649]|uniref:glycosyltransferase n=1 Tax=Janibacter sp. HTCC2649 TaxID=313589 RepID=UPI000066ED46|nr:glycosyltransferase [Janibacter sp. HTCC2649]EAP99602.1 Lipopolysaccharide biosynthesis protein [Janibacter sp. HTCC2649]
MGTAQPSADRVRVLWLVKGLGPGGAEQLLLLAAGVVDRDRFDYRLAYVRPDKTHLVPEFEAKGLVPQRLGLNASGPALRAAWVADLRRAMADADIVHAHSPVLASAARLVARSLPRAQRPIVVTTEHNEWTSHRTPTRLLNGITSPLDAHHWAVSDQVRSTVWNSRREGYEVLIHGIDPATVSPAPGTRERLRAELGIAADEVLSLTVANLRANKDYPNLLRAARAALDLEPRLRFAAVGQGPLVDEVADLHRSLNLGDRFLLLGFRRDVHDLMAAADIFTLASAHEGLPVAVMEAFAAGLPIVATDVGGLPQQVTAGVEGLLVTPGDSKALADALVSVARADAMRQRMGAAALARVADYDIRRAVTEQEKVYAALAAPSRRG